MVLNSDIAPDVYRVADLPPELAAKIAIAPVTGCWLFQVRDTGQGYVQARWNGKSTVAHRVIYELLVGAIPPGLVLDHVEERGCRYRHCCWPLHLEPVTQKVNIERSLANRNPRDSCRRGHKFTPETTYVSPKGVRACRICHRARRRGYRAARRAAREVAR